VFDQRGRLLRAALGFAGLVHPPRDRALTSLRAWLDSWAGIGRVAAGMQRQGLAADPSTTSATGTGWEPTPWHATQREALFTTTDGVLMGSPGPGSIRAEALRVRLMLNARPT